MATFWERAAHSFICSLCIMTICVLVISKFGFKGGTLVLVGSIPGHCLPFAF